MTLTTIDYAMFAAASNETDRLTPDRQIPPSGWAKLSGEIANNSGLIGSLGHSQNIKSGFEATAYQKDKHIVISYAGTNRTDFKEWFTDLEIGAVGTANQQIKDAAVYYQAIKKQYPNAEIEFTGHSLGGGLAALMGVFFNKKAYTFDPAPFRLAATEKVAHAVANYLTKLGYQSDIDLEGYYTIEQPLNSVKTLLNTILGNDFIGDNLYPTTIRGEENVQAYVLNGEFLTNGLDVGLGNIEKSLNALKIMDSLTVIDTNDHGFGLNFGDYHSIDLLTLALAAPTLTEVAKVMPQTFTAIMKDDIVYDNRTNQSSFIVHLLNESLHQNTQDFLHSFREDFTKISRFINSQIENKIIQKPTWQRAITDIIIDHYAQHNAHDLPNSAIEIKNKIIHFDTTEHTPLLWMNNYLNSLDSQTVLTNYMINHYLQEYSQKSWYSLLDNDSSIVEGEQIFSNVLLTNKGNDILIGGNKEDLLIAKEGDDVLDGKYGIDIMIGGKGDDTYYVDNINDIVHEVVGEGKDTVISTVNYHLSHNIENLILQGSDNLAGRGNFHNNMIIGNDGNNILYGEFGNDILVGGVGNDTLIGGIGNDTYVFNFGDGYDIIDDQGGTLDFNIVSFGQGIHIDDIIFSLNQHGNLEIDFQGNDSDGLLISHWQDNNQISQFQFDNGKILTANYINNLIDDMENKIYIS
ncbi:lipase family protein [Suttonella ornithocola]|uniref:Cyclolysin n=1 Tax=Suttonella ornithocola TaxID=279832 RepID=A0A380N153_9GAMM|nr:Mbeg1-like protein [Suttonella ornithocola]SUO97863.1 Cyclolysin [Suttonella ornithocola]